MFYFVCVQDAHNCILEFDEETAMFAVYDGHGGNTHYTNIYILYLNTNLTIFYDLAKPLPNPNIDNAEHTAHK